MQLNVFFLFFFLPFFPSTAGSHFTVRVCIISADSEDSSAQRDYFFSTARVLSGGCSYTARLSYCPSSSRCLVHNTFAFDIR